MPPAPLAALLLALGLCAARGGEPEDWARPAEDSVSLLQHGLALGPHAAAQRTVPAKLVVDLDAAPEQRWRNVTQHYRALGVFPGCCNHNISSKVLRVLEAVPLAEVYRRELEGIVADVGHPDVTVESLLLLNIGYELTGWDEPASTVAATAARLLGVEAPQLPSQPFGCSGILAAMPDGTVVHGRNMDYAGFEVKANGRTLHYPDVTVEVLFTKKGAPFISSVQWPGFIGFHTAMRFGGWSFEQNTRFHGMETDMLFGVIRHSEGFMLRARGIMETTPDFETAVQRLYNSNMMAPQYFIVAGARPYEGAVLSMDRGGQHLQGKGTPALQRLSKSTLGFKGDQVPAEQVYVGWHLVQTNDDNYATPRDSRRPAEELRLSAVTQDMVNPQWMYLELTSQALLLPNTVFSTVYVPATGYSQTSIHLGGLQ